MDDLSSRDDEKAREQATEKGRKAEQDRQRNEEKAREQATEKGRKEEQDQQKVREQATEKGRKQGLKEERAREKGKGGSGIKILLWIILLVIVILAVSLLTLSVTVTNVTPGNALPFTTNYGVSFPEGQTITIGNTHINVLSFENELISDIDGDRQKLVVGEDRVISERRAVITTLGAITLMDTNFEINLKYKGERDNRAYFDMAVHTSKQVPEILLNQLLPSEIDARPI
ncbi:MAG: hypothetical protein LUQ04_03390 [Methanoregula sp.]|nr:hypothetical protein [Methanoregula sp.]